MYEARICLVLSLHAYPQHQLWGSPTLLRHASAARIGTHGVYLDFPTSVSDPVAKVVKSAFSKTHDRVLLLLSKTAVANGSKSEVVTGNDLSNGVASVALDKVGSNVEAVVTLRRPGVSFHLVPKLTSFSHEIEVVVTFPSSTS
jgi:hypothetical protein